MEVGRREGGGRRTLSQINVTPFVDVMLVLLIIFMVTAPMMQTGVEINLPEAQAPTLEQIKEPLIVSVSRQGEIVIGGSRVESPAKLTPVLAQVLQNRETKEVFLEADRDVPYGRVLQVMAAIKGAGVEKVGMVSELPEAQTRR